MTKLCVATRILRVSHLANAESLRKGQNMNYRDYLTDTRDNPAYANLTPSTDEMLVAVLITIARVDRLAPESAVARLDAFISTRKGFISKLNIGATMVIDTAYKAALESFDATILTTYGPLVAEEITLESTRY